MSNISRDDVANLAKLARIDLSEDELAGLASTTSC
jgi:Asp-tRNA(Asn)/Glu-tRNA(Gln) amidotransferase C subunit